MTDIEEARQLVAYDWLITEHGHRLHWAPMTDAQAQTMWDERQLFDTVRLSCGRCVAYVGIPGVLTRMSAKRCARCCKALGYPTGNGSPKNDDRCRAISGLPPSGGAA